MLVPGRQTRTQLEEPFEQHIDRRSFGQFDRFRPPEITELGKVLNLNQHSQLFKTPINGKFRYRS